MFPGHGVSVLANLNHLPPVDDRGNSERVDVDEQNERS